LLRHCWFFLFARHFFTVVGNTKAGANPEDRVLDCPREQQTSVYWKKRERVTRQPSWSCTIDTGNRIFRFAYRLLVSVESAEDVTHDCFLSLIRKPENYRPDELP
jgi:hypothetical protein